MSGAVALLATQMAKRPRLHMSVVKPGCHCHRCSGLRERAKDLRGIIMIYEQRLAEMKKELWRLESHPA